MTDILDILLLTVIFYYLFLFIRGTRGVQLLKGLVLIFIVTFLVRLLDLRTLTWFLEKVLAFGALAILIVFQPEIRNALTKLAEPDFFISGVGVNRENIQKIVAAVFELVREGRGALVVIERNVGLLDFAETGTPINAEVSKELLVSLFAPRSTLHDGAVIISKNRIISAGCLLPLSERQELDPSLGTRHRAALGLSEQTDSLVLIVSEEKSMVSVAKGGNIFYHLTPEKLTRMLEGIMLKSSRKRKQQR